MKHIRKKAVSLIAAAALVLSVSACGDAGSSASETVALPQSALEPAQPAASEVPVYQSSAAESSAAEASAPAPAPEPEPEAPSPWIDHLVSGRVISQVYGDGQKIAAVALEYDAELDPASVSPEDYTVEGYEIVNAYVSDTPALSGTPSAGAYVLLELSTDYILPNYAMILGIGDPNAYSNQLTTAYAQTGDIQDAIGSEFTGSETMLETDDQENVNLGVDDFQQLIYTNPEDESTLMYNLYVPQNADDGSSYPLVLFMPDATGAGADPVKTLTQGLGAVIWATPESQAENPCFVLAPQYNNGAEDYDNTLALLADLVEQYNVDADRLYVTGQSAGTIKAIQMMIDDPELFAGAMLVAGQAENGYEERISQLYTQNIWMIASTGDARANPGMTAIMEAVEAEGTDVTEGSWSALLPEEEQNAEAAQMEEAGTAINFTILSDVVPEGVTDSDAAQHLNTWRVAYSISEIRNWLFRQSR